MHTFAYTVTATHPEDDITQELARFESREDAREYVRCMSTVGIWAEIKVACVGLSTQFLITQMMGRGMGDYELIDLKAGPQWDSKWLHCLRRKDREHLTSELYGVFAVLRHSAGGYAWELTESGIEHILENSDRDDESRAINAVLKALKGIEL